MGGAALNLRSFLQVNEIEATAKTDSWVSGNMTSTGEWSLAPMATLGVDAMITGPILAVLGQASL